MMILLVVSSVAAVVISLLLAWRMLPFIWSTVRFKPEHTERDALIFALAAYWLYGLGISKLLLVRFFAGAPDGWFMPGLLVMMQLALILGCGAVLVMMRLADRRP